MKKTIAILLSLMTICMFSFTGCGGSGSSEDAGGSDEVLGKVEANPDGTLMPFALCPGMNDDGTVNFTELDENAACQVWNAETEAFEDADADVNDIFIDVTVGSHDDYVR